MTDIKKYFKNSSEVISSLEKNEEKIKLISEQILKMNKDNKKILVAGNGGSCSDAEHFTGELQCTYITSKSIFPV